MPVDDLIAEGAGMFAGQYARCLEVGRPVAVEDQLLVRTDLQALTAQERETVVLRHVLDLSVDHTAKVLGISPGAVCGR